MKKGYLRLKGHTGPKDVFYVEVEDLTPNEHGICSVVRCKKDGGRREILFPLTQLDTFEVASEQKDEE